MLIPLDILNTTRFPAWWFKKHPARPLMETVYTADVIIDDETRTFEFISPNGAEFRTNGITAAILPVTLPDGEVIDLVCWKPAAPEKWWLRRGQYFQCYLGWDDIEGYQSKNPHLWLYAGNGWCAL